MLDGLHLGQWQERGGGVLAITLSVLASARALCVRAHPAEPGQAESGPMCDKRGGTGPSKHHLQPESVTGGKPLGPKAATCLRYPAREIRKRREGTMSPPGQISFLINILKTWSSNEPVSTD